MSESTWFDTSASWIWCAAADRPRNNNVCFRRTFELDAAPSRAVLHITAETRYELHVNGRWLGYGPARSWPAPWPVETYDLTGLLRAGRNVVSVLVHHVGTSTFQSLDAEPGLLAQLDWQHASGQAQRIVTDERWRAVPHEAFVWPVPRISVQQSWAEHYDARRAPGGACDWRATDFDDATWPGATVQRAVGEPPHETFEARDIPLLTRDPMEARRVMSVEAVRPAPYQWTVEPKVMLNATDRTSNHVRGRLFLATHIYSEGAQAIELHEPHGRSAKTWWLNGTALSFDDLWRQPTDMGVAHARLAAGWNCLLAQLPVTSHLWRIALNVWTETEVRFAARPAERGAETPWLALGPFAPPAEADAIEWPAGPHGAPLVEADHVAEGADDAAFRRIREQRAPSASDLSAAYTRVCPTDIVTSADVFAICTSERVSGQASPAVEQPNALLHDTADWTTIHPTADDADVRFLVDFGDERVGFHEFEVDAPEGAVIDLHNFEFIQPNGRENLGERMSNTLRYVCHEGVQRYRTFVRRGFRYTWLSARNFDRPVRIRLLRTIMSTYPLAQRGDFACSDSELVRIWQAGAHSVRCCAEDTYTDCPTYEQTHWVGDARNEALVDAVAFGDPRLSAHCWRQAARSLERSPLVESHVPSGWQNVLPAWSFLWMRWAREHYELSGDDAFARESMPWLARNVSGIEAHRNDAGLFAMRAWNLFDWAPMDTPDDAVVTHVNCLAVLGLRDAAALARQIGERGRAEKWDALAEALSEAINREMWHGRRRAYVDCLRADGRRSTTFSQQTQTAAYISGVATGQRAARCLRLMQKPANDFVTAGSPFFMCFLLEALAREDRDLELVRAVRRYWGKQIAAGATTFWEMYHEGKDRLTRSHCHGWSAAPTYYLSRCVLGVVPTEPGYRSLRIAPQVADLSWARGRVPTPHGDVVTRWHRDRETFELHARVPTGVPVEMALPFDAAVRETAGDVQRTDEARVWHAPAGGDVSLRAEREAAR